MAYREKFMNVLTKNTVTVLLVARILQGGLKKGWSYGI